MNTLKPVSMSLAIRLVLFYLLIAEGIESNPRPGSGSGPRGARSPRGRGQGGRGSRRRDAPDIFAETPVGGMSGHNIRNNPPYSLRPRASHQPSVSAWLMNSQPPTQPNDSGRTDLRTAQSDMDLASENSETDDNLAEADTTALLLEIRRDVKKMNKKFDHLEKSVRTLKHDSKLLKEQNIRLTSQVTDLQTTVSQLESRTRDTEMKNERLETQSRRDNLRFHGFEGKRDETWEESELKVRDYIRDDLGVDESSIQIERAHRLRSKNSPRPVIVKFSHYKDRDKVLKVYREKRKAQNNDNLQGAMADPSEGNDERPDERRVIRVSEDFPERVTKARTNLYPFLKSSLEQNYDAFLKYDRLIVDGQEYEHDYNHRRPVPVPK